MKKRQRTNREEIQKRQRSDREEIEATQRRHKEKIEENGRTKKYKEISEFERMVSLVGYQNESDIELQ